MSAVHTPRQLIVGPGMHGTTKLLLSAPDGGNIAVAAYMTEADAERLAACWNACDGLSQDALDGGWTAKGLSSYAKSLEVRLIEAAALLRDVVRPHDEQAAQAEKSGTPQSLNPLAARIHEFLGAAGPLIAFARPLVRPPAPSDDALPDTEGGSCD